MMMICKRSENGNKSQQSPKGRSRRSSQADRKYVSLSQAAHREVWTIGSIKESRLGPLQVQAAQQEGRTWPCFFFKLKKETLIPPVNNTGAPTFLLISDVFKGVPVQIPFIAALIYSRFGDSFHSCSEQSTELLVTFISFCCQLHQISRTSITLIEAVLKIKLLQLTARDVLYMISIHPVPLMPSNTAVVSICKSVYLWITQTRRWTWTMLRGCWILAVW